MAALIPYGGTFLVFSDYCRPSIRLAALMGMRVIHVMTHDSIGLGEDGPTHQPVEHLAMLRAIPNLLCSAPPMRWKPPNAGRLRLTAKTAKRHRADPAEPAGPLRTDYTENRCAYGAYDLISASDAEVTIFASGSEIEIALEAHKALEANGHTTRVVSVPCFELFEEQSAEYKSAVIGDSKVKIAIEAGIRQGWDASSALTACSSA
jgi:transketolase